MEGVEEVGGNFIALGERDISATMLARTGSVVEEERMDESGENTPGIPPVDMPNAEEPTAFGAGVVLEVKAEPEGGRELAGGGDARLDIWRGWMADGAANGFAP